MTPLLSNSHMLIWFHCFLKKWWPKKFVSCISSMLKVVVCHLGWYEFLIRPHDGKFDCVGITYRLMKSPRDGEVPGGCCIIMMLVFHHIKLAL